MVKQRTLKNVIRATGAGVHTGQKVSLMLKPAPADTGIIFRRVDLDPVVEVPAKLEYVADTLLSSNLALGDVRVVTVEHLLSAFAGMGVDNAFVDLSAAEVPIMDGSSAPFVFLIQSAGVVEQQCLKKFIRIDKPVEVIDGDRWAKLIPYDGFKINFRIDFDHPVFECRNKDVCFNFSTLSYVKEVSRARTFGFKSQYEQIFARNLALGASLSNTIVIDEVDILNEDGLRYQDEFVRHKVLDVMGDLYLLGCSVIGQFSGHKSGHSMNNLLLNQLLTQPDAWSYVTFSAPGDVSPLMFSELLDSNRHAEVA